MNFSNDSSAPEPGGQGGEAASLTGIKLRRADRSAPRTKRGDLTAHLRSPAPTAAQTTTARESPTPGTQHAPTVVTREPHMRPLPIMIARVVPVPSAHAVPIAAPREPLPPTAPPVPVPVVRDAAPSSAPPARPVVAPQPTRPTVPTPIPVAREVSPSPTPPARPIVTPEPQRSSPPMPAAAAKPAPNPAPTASHTIRTADTPQPANSSPVHAALQDERALRHHWEQLRGRGDLPLFTNLDPSHVAANWANTLMVNYSAGETGMPHIARLGRHTEDVEYTSMVTEWILSCSRDVARTRKPTEKEERFPGEHRRRTYHMLLLPFASATGASDHVLCHLTCFD